MGISAQYSSITRGKRAALLLTQPGWNLTRLAYHYQTPYLWKVLLSFLFVHTPGGQHYTPTAPNA